MQAKLIDPKRIELQKGMAQEVFERVGDLNRTYYIETYGCQMNVRDSETIAGLLQEMGYTPAQNKENASVILFNTCCVRDHAEKRLLANIGALKERKESDPELIIGICGCMMQQQDVAKKVMRRFPFVNFVFGTNVLWRLPELMLSALNGERLILTEEEGFAICEGLPARRSNPFSAFVNITFGCDNFCSYCIVPYVRGRERSRDPERILADIRALLADGYKEINLLGQNVNSYGKDADFGVTFPELLRRIDALEGDFTVRFMTSHPKDATKELIDTIAASRHIAHQLHLPVQSGSSRILKLMNRYYDRETYLSLIRYAKEKISDLTLSSDIIVGFPGETDEDFEETISLLEEVKYNAIFSFIYSKRNGTPAAEMEDPTPAEVKSKRFDRLLETQNEIARTLQKAYVGRTMRVLVDDVSHYEDYDLAAKTDGGRLVHFCGDKSLLGSYVTVRITGCTTGSLFSELIVPDEDKK